METKLCKILFSFLRTESVQTYILGSIGFPSYSWKYMALWTNIHFIISHWRCWSIGLEENCHWSDHSSGDTLKKNFLPIRIFVSKEMETNVGHENSLQQLHQGTMSGVFSYSLCTESKWKKLTDCRNNPAENFLWIIQVTRKLFSCGIQSDCTIKNTFLHRYIHGKITSV